MKKKIFSLLVLLAAAVSGAWADEVMIGNEATTTTTYVTPYNSLWGFSYVEQVYTADEIGMAGTISSIAFCLSSVSDQTSEYDIFMKHVTRETFESVTDYEPVTADNMVYSGSITFSPGWTTITLDTPFEYDGTQNLMIALHEKTSGYSTRYFYCTEKNNSVISFHSDSANPDPFNLGSYTGTTYVSPKRSNIKINIESNGLALTTDTDAEAHGTISFTVGEGEEAVENATTAKAGDVVTVTITPEEDYVPGSTITVQPYGKIENAMARRNISGPSSLGIAQPFEVPITITETETETLFTATFTMPDANARISVPYLKLLSSDDITIEAIPDQTFTGQAIEPTLVVKDGTTELEEGVDYTVSYFNNTNAAQTTDENPPVAAITAVVGSEKYVSSNVIKFNILPATITDEMITEIGDQTYTTNPIEPALTITFGEGENAMTLTKGTDFTVVYSNNVTVGLATATVTGQGNFTGEASADFDIIPKPLSDDMISPIDDLEYTGEAQEPELDVNFNGKPLVEGVDYTLEYTDNVEAGKATATITGMGNYTGEASANFYVGRVDLNDETRINIAYIYWEDYDGDKHTPRVEVRDGLVPLVLDVDYKMTFKDNVEAGTARITFQGLGNYKGKVNKYFAIKSYVLDIDMVQDIADQTWTGEAVTPAISVINGNVTLTQDKDFTVKFKNNVNEGTATVIVNGTGNFRSIDLVKTFKIVKKAEVAEPEAVDSPGEATAIDGVKAAKAGKTAYDLQGRKVVGNRKAVVIIDGKLVLKK